MKASRIFTFMLVFALLITGALAFSVSEAKLGGESQERFSSVSTTISVTGTDSAKTVKNITATFNAESKYQLKISAVSASAGTFVLGGYVPKDLDAVDSKGKIISPKISDMTVTVIYTDNTTESTVVPVNMQAENKLAFASGTTITIADKSSSKLRDEKDFDEVRRGDKITMDFEAENKFSSSGDCPVDGDDCTIESVDLNFVAGNSDFDDDDLSFGDLKSDRKSTESLSFTVPDDVEDDDYDFDVYMVGTDENGAKHGDFMSFTLTIDVPRDEVTVTDAFVTPSELVCTARRATLKVLLENTGRDDQDKAAVEIESSILDIKDSKYNIAIDQGDTSTQTFDLYLPADVMPGVYYISVQSFTDNSDESDIGTATLTIKECTTPQVPDDNEDTTPPEDDSNTDVNIIEVPPTSGVIVGDKKEDNFFASPAYLFLLIGVFLLALLMFFVLIVLILRK
ncbi:MAG: hypothetical protein ABIJ34_01470 [archaeon]